jgi:4-hydroxybenzoate polyprenyltransferase
VDLPVWAAARGGSVVSNDRRLVEEARSLTKIDKVFARKGSMLKNWFRALRVHQYSKNLLLLLPLAGAHKWSDPKRVASTLAGMAAFCICASGVYMLNDLLDMESDRHHPTKRRRPFASGKIPITHGFLAVAAAMVVSAGLALSVNWRFAAVLAVYYLLTVLYSLRLKEVELIDVLVLAVLYAIRILAGGYSANVPVSDWLLLFSIFLFLSLAFAKRFTELRLSFETDSEKIKGRGYLKTDTELISAMGVGSGYLSVLVLGIYITQPAVTELYEMPRALLLACPVSLYWLSRVWLLAHRGQMHDDPIFFALTDRQSWIAAALIALAGIVAGPK